MMEYSSLDSGSMASSFDRPLRIELTLDADQPDLLEGLDQWLQLGLLSDQQMRNLARTQLSCRLPTPRPSVSSTLLPVVPPPVSRTLSTDALPSPAPTPPVPPRRRQGVALLLSSLMAEISVLWLLFLGVFMVVVSSGVLAASQWQNFSNIGQYSILLSYTLAFWLAGAWAIQRPNLRLTGRMLQLVTLLIIPVNFWTIDRLHLGQSAAGLGFSTIAVLALSAIAVHLLQSQARSVQINSLALSWLQLGWGFPLVPLLATYLGTIVTAFLQARRGSTAKVQEQQVQEQQGIDLGRSAISITTLILVARAILEAGVPLHQLGLAFGICGWLLCWLNRQTGRLSTGRLLWTQVGVGLLLLGWSVTVAANPPWQAIAVSGLGLWLLGERLRRSWQRQDCTALFLVTLQTYCLLWWLLPSSARQALLNLAAQWAGASLQGWELVGLGVFPVVVLAVGFSVRLRQWEQPALAMHAERLALILGLLLTVLSAFNPWVRSLTLLLSTGLLAIVLRLRSSPSPGAIYLTHIAGLLTLLSGLDACFPMWGVRDWVLCLLIVTAAEWGLSLVLRQVSWQPSAWLLGLGLATIATVLLTNHPLDAYWSLLGLVTPGLLLIQVYYPNAVQPRLASWLVVITLMLAQVAAGRTVNTFLISSGVATVLMLLNTLRLQQALPVSLTIGLALAGSSTAVWQYGPAALDLPTWLAIVLWGLWLLHGGLRQHPTPLTQLYRQALNGWAAGVCLVTLGLLTGAAISDVTATHLSGTTLQPFLLAAGLTTGAIGFRLWQHPTNLGFYGLAWGVELLWTGILRELGGGLEAFAIANLALALLTQVSGDIWNYRLQPALVSEGNSPAAFSPEFRFSSGHVIPLLYALLGLLSAHVSFTATTGLYTLAAAVVGIGVGRRQVNFKPFTYLAVLGLSIAAYELLIYQLMQASGGMPGDGVALLASVAAGIALLDRLLASHLLWFWRLQPSELRLIAQLHWGVGSLLWLLALALSLSSTGAGIWTGVAIVLISDALWQGRSHGAWVYVGVVEAWIVLSYLLERNFPALGYPHWAAAITSVLAFGLYRLPWRSWGWSPVPWRRAALLLPGSMACLTQGEINLQSLLITAAVYAWFAKAEANIRLSYLSVLLADWAILRLFVERAMVQPLWYATVVSVSLLYLAQVEPLLRSPSQREQRHLLRSLATGLLCFTAFYQADTNFFQGMLTLALGMSLILVGLTLRTRAFLYVGTLTFIAEILRQLWLFIHTYALLLWAIGILLGLVFIWIAATFEARRSQAIALVQHWLTELETWE